MNWRAKIAALILLGSFGGTALAEPLEKPRSAGGIRTDFGDVLIENLGIGQTYNLRDLAGIPMKVTNTGLGTVNLVMDVVIPTQSFITSRRQELGFEAVPSVDWVSLSRSQFIVPSGESALTDVIIKIPNDPKLYGRKFQASIYSRTTGDGFLQLGVWSHLQMTIVRSPEAQAEAEKNHKKGIVGNMDYTLLPDKVSLEKFPLGRPVDIRKETKRTIMLANSGETAIDIRMKVVPLGDTPLTLQSGFEEPKDRSWLKLKADRFVVEPASFEDPGLVLHIPKDPKFSKKKYMFVIKAEPADPKIIGVTYYGKVYVETE